MDIAYPISALLLSFLFSLIGIGKVKVTNGSNNRAVKVKTSKVFSFIGSAIFLLLGLFLFALKLAYH
ncbi:hypothetical protein N475_10705 [Pseudoalteromonas luteoviolacea DSM 6061]|uniref:Uncharacterized protein n=1 Tax=Pseudoalteromonas luteoviolacea DSM 6061 TaxID=1365250 RepID=A0A166Y7T7_9GAMM|nr:hypothetical protein N475_10705 [Pseudoalteromonas luteoviolacea DSM 6061]